MKSFGKKNLIIFLVLGGTVALVYQIPFLRFTFYDQMTTALQLNDTQMGVLASVLNFVYTLCYPIGGFLASRFSLRRLMQVTLAGYLFLTVAFAFTTNYYALIAIHILYGIFGVGTFWSAYLTGIRNLGDESMQSKLFGSAEAARGIFQTFTAFIFLAVMNIAATPVLGFRGVMLVGAAFIGVFLILSTIFLPNEKEAKAAKAAEEKFSLKDVLTNKGVWITIMVIMCAYVSWTLGSVYLTTYTVRVLGIDESTASTIGIVRSYIIVFLAGFMGGWFVDKFTYKGKAFLVLFSAAILIVSAIMATSAVVPVCIALTLLMAFVANVMKSTYWSVMGQAGIPLGMTAIASGIISFIAYIPDFIVPTVAGVWLDAATAAGDVSVGFNKIFLLMIVFAVVGLFFAFLLMKRTKDIQAQEASDGESQGNLPEEVA